MSLQVYYPADIRNALAAAEQAQRAALQAAGGGSDFVQGFQEGYRAALTTVALAFGLIPRPEAPGAEWETGIPTTSSLSRQR